MKHKNVYQKNLADYYDLVYAWKNYKSDTDYLKEIINQHKESAGNDLLEIACGTGNYLKLFKDDFKVCGIDYSQPMLKIARKKLSGVKLIHADMTNFNLRKKFDVILCLFSSIAYLKNKSQLKKTIQNFSNHLKPGGILIIEPWLTPAKYRPGRPDMTTYQDKKIKVARFSVGKKQGNISVFDMHFMIAEKDKTVNYFIERHELMMFEKKYFLQYMQECNLKSRLVKKGLMRDRGLYIGIKT